ncbi:hypothetical protein VNO77_44658 [Canavalia gladiata]|uniref:Uncharacterized protein n=1 Tax=Canavalia gladiata TaxID=3824 RepID=A0AAN9JYL6_CANGL
MIQVPTCPLCVSELMLVLFSYCIRNISVDLPKASLVSAPDQPGLYVIHGPRLTVFRFTIHAPGIWEPIHQPIALHLIPVDWFLGGAEGRRERKLNPPSQVEAIRKSREQLGKDPPREIRRAERDSPR